MKELSENAIMGNHIHLLLQVGKSPLAKIMQGIQQRYMQYYNWHQRHSGHVFEQRYKAFLCEEESYLMAPICYIYHNPVRENIPEGIDYRWSSHHAYIKRINGLVNQEQLVGKCRIRQVVAARKRLIYEAIERNLMTRAQLAKVLQIDPANITRIWQQLMDVEGK